MDEPTNDLDTDTLELLEDLLLDYPGTLLLVSHDRTFLNSVVTSTLVLEGNGRVGEYVGGYDDWLRQRKTGTPVVKEKTPARSDENRSRRSPRQTLSFNELRELESLPQTIENLEEEQTKLYETMSEPSFYQQGGPEIVNAKARLKCIETELDEAYHRWEILDLKARAIATDADRR